MHGQKSKPQRVDVDGHTFEVDRDGSVYYLDHVRFKYWEEETVSGKVRHDFMTGTRKKVPQHVADNILEALKNG